MDVILKVLEGAKVGTKVAVKKEEFLIGRSPKCHLCAGSSSISRKHCALIRSDASVSVKDLGSRNGTLINGEKIEKGKAHELQSGDELTVGSLRFLVTISHGIKNTKTLASQKRCRSSRSCCRKFKRLCRSQCHLGLVTRRALEETAASFQRDTNHSHG